MRRYGILPASILSFYSRSVYADVARHWRGIGAGYLLALLAIVWIPVVGQMYFQARNVVRHELPKFADQIPAIEFAHGQLRVEGEQPVFLRDPETREVVAIIDTTGQVTSLEGREALVLVTSDKLIARNPSTGRIETNDLSQVPYEFKTSGQDLLQYADKGLTLVPLYYPLAVTFSFVYRLTLALIGGAVALVIAPLFGARLSYAGGARIAAVAMTPGIVIGTLLGVLPVGGAIAFAWALLGWLVPICYLVFGVKATASRASADPYEPPGYRQLSHEAANGQVQRELETAGAGGTVPLESARYLK